MVQRRKTNVQREVTCSQMCSSEHQSGDPSDLGHAPPTLGSPHHRPQPLMCPVGVSKVFDTPEQLPSGVCLAPQAGISWRCYFLGQRQGQCPFVSLWAPVSPGDSAVFPGQQGLGTDHTWKGLGKTSPGLSTCLCRAGGPACLGLCSALEDRRARAGGTWRHWRSCSLGGFEPAASSLGFCFLS